MPLSINPEVHARLAHLFIQDDSPENYLPEGMPTQLPVVGTLGWVYLGQHGLPSVRHGSRRRTASSSCTLKGGCAKGGGYLCQHGGVQLVHNRAAASALPIQAAA